MMIGDPSRNFARSGKGTPLEGSLEFSAIESHKAPTEGHAWDPCVRHERVERALTLRMFRACW
jgi:hypothetical protein